MIYLFTGTPGSGKSLHASSILINRLNRKLTDRRVIANFEINEKYNRKGSFTYCSNENLEPRFFIEYSKNNLVFGKENQCLIFIDECQILFNSRDWQACKNRMDWIKFFTQHRKLGYDIYLITQQDRMLDRQIRNLAEYHVIHRKCNNFKFFRFIPISTFVAITYWYGCNERINSEFFTYKKKLGDLYNSYKMFDNAL